MKICSILIQSVSLASLIGFSIPSYSQGLFWNPKIQRNVFILEYSKGFTTKDRREVLRKCRQDLRFRFFTESHFDQSISKGIKVVYSKFWEYQVGSRTDPMYGVSIPLICGGTKYTIEGPRSLVDGLYPDGSEI